MTYSTPSYGSGSSNWGGSGYDSCVQQCVAQFGAPAATSTAPTSTSTDMGSSGGGATHTVIVAPTQGVLRYVPFAINASVGDTVKFVWGANVHTVTKSSALTPCNKTADAPFTSGSQNKSFVFEQVINTTDTTFYYCGTPTHCQKGMFGIINPPSATGGMSVGGMMASMAANDSSLAAQWSYTNSQTAGKTVAASWGSSIDMSSMPEWSYPYMAQNVMYNRVFLAKNDDVIKPDGTVDLGAAGTAPLMIPPDITAALANNGAATPSTPDYSTTSTSSTPAASSPAASASPASAASTNGASSLGSPSLLVALMAVVATFFAL
jgi:plastocyanin